MKKKSLQKFQHHKYTPYKDKEGNTIEKYEESFTEDEALIWQATSKLQIQLYGLKIHSIMNMHYYGNLDIQMHDMIVYDGEKYKIISTPKSKRFKAFEMEKI